MGKIGNHTGYHPNTPPPKKKEDLGMPFNDISPSLEVVYHWVHHIV